MFTTIAYGESLDGGGVIHNIQAVQDQHVRTQGDFVYIPRTMPNIIGVAILSAATTSLISARLNSPGLRRIAYPDIEPLVQAVTFGSPPESIIHPESPTPLAADEGLGVEIVSDGAAAYREYGIIWLSDGQQEPISGQIYPVAAKSTITLSPYEWVNGNITFDQLLPVGTYEIVGMRARGTALVTARLVFSGESVGHRPGVPAVNDISDMDQRLCRYGRLGSFGRFDSLTPPTIDCLGVSGSVQDYIFDLIKVT